MQIGLEMHGSRARCSSGRASAGIVTCGNVPMQVGARLGELVCLRISRACCHLHSSGYAFLKRVARSGSLCPRGFLSDTLRGETAFLSREVFACFARLVLDML